VTARPNDTWEDSERHRLGPYGATLPDEPGDSNGRTDLLWKGLAWGLGTLAIAAILVFIGAGWWHI
jgi:hypothetical protein